MTEPLIVGAMVRTLGAYPSGWRHPGAHADPQADAPILRRIARLGEDAGLDYLFFGDWLATGPDLEFRDPYLLARIDPVSAVLYLAGITERIGLIATVNTTYADPYATARATASLDLLTGGRAGVNLVTGAEPRAAANHGRDAHADNATRYDRAEEFVRALRLLWESWDEDAWIADRLTGTLIDENGLRGPGFRGEHVRVEGPLNVARPPQVHPPIVHAGTSDRSRALAATEADLALIASPDLHSARETRAVLRAAASAAGRSPDDIKVIAPVLPVVAETDAAAHAIVDRLLLLVPIDDGESPHVERPGFPANRSLAAFLDAAELAPDDPSRGAGVDEPVDAVAAARFGEAAARTLALVEQRTGRRVGGEVPVTWRHLIAAHAVPAAFVVGDASTVADHFERWSDERAADGFNVLSAFQPDQFEAFTVLAVPELRRRGLLGRQGDTLRERLGLAGPRPAHAPVERSASSVGP
ncbi:NtaA/DmoA family FMN-dependent monooxygenase [Microbacterium immunditiarum]|uniref:FMN-dependent oxidoreductase (Nitrilotriacetate monooxygenase family) n=1 Tax=Microbacterium immunditiarum TaxID=337480 RepID=A0A7Y9GRR7_9MICO|nr:NtaA/DmoA family FMN-dependent monooxygenase [Microbacterium immunditiarum]NYE21449.1 FMN-dependent oxidoreductase (nitrilotriacetate monooxygenase family) [Microbacterium immunditiarum]